MICVAGGYCQLYGQKNLGQTNVVLSNLLAEVGSYQLHGVVI